VKQFRWALDEPQLLRDRIAGIIRKAIISGELIPGEKLSEPELSQKLGISRTPLREAIRILEQEGFLVVIPRRGAFVTEVSSKDVEDIYVIKSTLEGLAARLAAPHMEEKDLRKMEEINRKLQSFSDPGLSLEFFRIHSEFHFVFLKASGNERLFQINKNLMDHFQRFGIISFSLPGRYREATSQHEEIIDAFRRQDAASAERLVFENVKTGGDALVAAVRRREVGGNG
jgi:DNA-binding GntR family transcriptional regulator